MKYIRQLLFKCKNRKDLEFLYFKLQELTLIEHVEEFVIMECINQDKYDYIDCQYNCSVLLYFSSLNDIEKYCIHPLHVNFVETMLQKVDITVLDYSVNQ